MLAHEGVTSRLEALDAEPAPSRRRRADDGPAARVRREEASIQTSLRAAGEAVTPAEVAAQRLRDQAAEAELGAAPSPSASVPEARRRRQRERRRAPRRQPVQVRPSRTSGAASSRSGRAATRRREKLGPVNPLARTRTPTPWRCRGA